MVIEHRDSRQLPARQRPVNHSLSVAASKGRNAMLCFRPRLAAHHMRKHLPRHETI